jgi:hypothetical protein
MLNKVLCGEILNTEPTSNKPSVVTRFLSVAMTFISLHFFAIKVNDKARISSVLYDLLKNGCLIILTRKPGSCLLA